MTGKLKLSAVICIVVVAAVQCTATEGLARSRRETPPLPPTRPPTNTPPRAPARPNLLSCCPGMPTLLSLDSKAGCMIASGQPPRSPSGGMPPKPTGVPQAGVPPTSGRAGPRNNTGHNNCLVECAYKNLGVVVGGVLSTKELKAQLTKLASNNAAWAGVIEAAATACTIGAPDVPVNAPCKSGAAEINYCLSKYILKNCPTGIRVESDVCTGLRQNVTLPSWG